jgi:hypothetical protein
MGESKKLARNIEVDSIAEDLRTERKTLYWHLLNANKDYRPVFRRVQKRRRYFRSPIKILHYVPVKGLMHDPMFGDDDWWFKIGPALTSSGVADGKSSRIYQLSDTYVFSRHWFLRNGFNPFIPREFNGPGFPGFSRKTRSIPTERHQMAFVRM